MTQDETPDLSAGYDAISEQFADLRGQTGAKTVREWALSHLPKGGSILDVGCGTGQPIAETLFETGFTIAGVDSSPKLLAKFKSRFPKAEAICEAAQDSDFFVRQFDGVIAIGLVFLCLPPDQEKLIRNMAAAVKPDGHLLFTAPRQIGRWKDNLTQRESISLGQARYEDILTQAGLKNRPGLIDEGGNHYYAAVKPAG